MIADWYGSFYKGSVKNMYEITVEQILFYTKEASKQNLIWTK